ncbi:MAG: zinc-binding alcohol dehydrogenase family protein [Sphaerochaeta sp.]|nr:zinc-binding alcohol dehydrogenase family protein [Sphaerochaeta sp.]
MKAIQVIKPFEVAIVDVMKPEISDGHDVLIRVTSGGICGSDVGIYNGSNSLATYPRIIGHEFGGFVQEIGKDVSSVKIGDRVAINPVVSCGKCYACSIGHSNVCSTLEVIGVHRDGGFSEFVKVPEGNVHRFSTDFEETLLGLVEPFSIGMQVNNRAQITKGDKVLIMGAGPIGMTILQVAKSRGAAVMVSDIVSERLVRALAMGADAIVDISTEDVQNRVLQFTNGEGMPVVVDTACLPKTFEQSIALASPAGRVVVIGLKSAPSAIAMADITKKELTIIGSRLNLNCFETVIESFEKGSLHPEQLTTSQYPFEQIQEALNDLVAHPERELKVVLTF